MLQDASGRIINYLRLSVTDRCNLRCTYCMSETMKFLPHDQVLTYEELMSLVDIFVDRGIEHLRLTGGEPLIRRDINVLIRKIGQLIDQQRLKSFNVTTNGIYLTKYAGLLVEQGCKRVNISLDTLDPERFHALTRVGKIQQVIDGVNAAVTEGLAIKINTVVMPDTPDEDLFNTIVWCAERGFDISLIEWMPLGELNQFDENSQYNSVTDLRRRIHARWPLTLTDRKTNGPSRYYYSHKLGIHIGMITPLTDNFCADCNRLRLTCNGLLYPCLGHDNSTDLGGLVKQNASLDVIHQAINTTLEHKPLRHDFQVMQFYQSPYVKRYMNQTGG